MAAMTPFPYSVHLDTLLTDARTLMKSHNVNHLPIIEDNKIVGVISRRDIRARKEVKLSTDDKSNLRIQDAYVSKPYIVGIHEPLENVLLTMAEMRHSAALVVKHEKLVGILTYIDVCRYLGNYLKEKYSSSNNDAA